jgi:predicted  nucleic acid-binding Zn-ribbon protein
MKNLTLNPMKNRFVNEDMNINGSKTQIDLVNGLPHVSKGLIEKKVNLKNWGFMQAGSLQGSVKGLLNSIQIVFNSYINEASSQKGEKQDEINKEINDVTNAINLVNIQVSKVKEVDIPEQQMIMEELKNEIDKVNTKAGEEYIKSQFSWAQTSMATFFALMLGFALFTFYTSLVYSSLFKDFGNAIQGATVDNFSMLFNSLFDITVFKKPSIFTAFSFVLATVFTAIAFTMHKLWDNGQSKWRYFHVAVLALVALSMEVFFAVKLEKNIYELKLMTGQAEYGLSTWDLIFSVDVAIVLILGFVSYIVWSIILKLSFNEWEKRNYKRLAVLKTKELNKKYGRAKYKVSEFNNKLNKLSIELGDLQEKLKSLQLKLSNAFFDSSELEGRLSMFFQGWLQYVKSNNNTKSQVDTHTQLFNERKLELTTKLPKIF